MRNLKDTLYISVNTDVFLVFLRSFTRLIFKFNRFEISSIYENQLCSHVTIIFFFHKCIKRFPPLFFVCIVCFKHEKKPPKLPAK